MATKHHEKSRNGISNEWYTPQAVLDALGTFDLDPSFPTTPIYTTSKRQYTIHDDGLKQPWSGRVFMNPPYGELICPFMSKLADHGNGVCLIYARTETRWFFNFVWERASAILFLKGRVKFYRIVEGKIETGSATAPCVLVAYGAQNVDCLAGCGLDGKLIVL